MDRSQMRHNVHDSAGNVIQNALCLVYLEGTTTPVTDMYAAETGGSPIATLTSDAQGDVVGWFTAAKNVDVSVTDNSHTAHYPSSPTRLLTWAAFTETMQVPVEPSTVAAVNSTSAATFDLLDPFYGVQVDVVADQVPAFNSLIAALPAGARLVLPNGTHRLYVASALELTKDITIEGPNSGLFLVTAMAGFSDAQIIRNWQSTDYHLSAPYPATRTVTLTQFSNAVADTAATAGDLGALFNAPAASPAVANATITAVTPGVGYTITTTFTGTTASGVTATLGDVPSTFYAPNTCASIVRYVRLPVGFGFDVNGASNITCLGLVSLQERAAIGSLVFANQGATPVFGNVPIALFCNNSAPINGPVHIDRPIVYSRGWKHNIFGDGTNGGTCGSPGEDLRIAGVTSSSGTPADGLGCSDSPFSFTAFGSIRLSAHIEAMPPNSALAVWAASTQTQLNSIIVVGGGVWQATVAGISGGTLPAFPTMWQPNTAYALNAFATPPVNRGVPQKATAVSGSGTSGATPPVFSTLNNQTVVDNTGANQITWTAQTAAFTVTDGGVTWTYKGALVNNSQAWVASRWYPVGATITVAGYVYRANTAGISGGTQPSWPTTLGATVADGTANWTVTSGSNSADTAMIRLTNVAAAHLEPHANPSFFYTSRPLVKVTKTGAASAAFTYRSPEVIDADIYSFGDAGGFVGPIIDDGISGVVYSYPTYPFQRVGFYDGALLAATVGPKATAWPIAITPGNPNLPKKLNGLLAASVPDLAFASTGNSAHTVATLYVALIPLDYPILVTNVLIQLGVIATSSTLTHSFVALFDSAGTFIGQSADQSSDWGSGGVTGVKTLALTNGPFQCTPRQANDWLWAGIYVGTTSSIMPRFTVSNNGTLLPNWGTASNRRRGGSVAIADTATLTSITPNNLGSAVPPVIALS